MAKKVITDLEVVNALSGTTKGYRMRTSGSSLDYDFHGAALILSGFDGPGYAGTQRPKIVLKINEDVSQLLLDWEFSNSAFGAIHHWISGRTGGLAIFNEDGHVDADFRVESDTDTHQIFSDAGTNKVGIGLAVPATKLDVGGAFRSAKVTLTDAANIATNAALGNHFKVTLAGNRTMDNPTNPVDGQKIVYQIKQDGTGSRTITWGTAFRFSGGTAPTLTTAANKTDYLGFVYDSTEAKWDLLAERFNF